MATMHFPYWNYHLEGTCWAPPGPLALLQLPRWQTPPRPDHRKTDQRGPEICPQQHGL